MQHSTCVGESVSHMNVSTFAHVLASHPSGWKDNTLSCLAEKARATASAEQHSFVDALEDAWQVSSQQQMSQERDSHVLFHADMF